MKRLFLLFSAFCLLIMSIEGVKSQNVFRFGHIGTEQGLSQNTGSSILFDSKGFMWIGTMNGLNRYDGYEFRIYKGQSATSKNFTNNRVTRLWEDKRGFIWAETYDGYYHFFNPRTEVFSTIPDYKENIARNFRINSFLQYSDDIILLGSNNAGIFVLQYNKESSTYNVNQYPDKGNQPLSNNNIRFIYADKNHDIWIGTSKGINFLASEDFSNNRMNFRHWFVNASFTTVCDDGQEIWLGTEESGIIVYNPESRSFSEMNESNHAEIPSSHVSFLAYTRSGHRIAGFSNGIVLINRNQGGWDHIPFHGRSLNGVYEDRYQQLWLTALEFGVTRYDPQNNQAEYFVLTPEEMKHLTDLERPQFFEDRNNNLWIGLHGGGLALYRRNDNKFQFFRNDPRDPNSISSNIIHSIAEDMSGQIWLGTGQFLGGIEKVIMENQAFRHILAEQHKTDMLDNVVRAIMEDRNRKLWVATKAGRIHIFDSSLNKLITLDSLPGIGKESVRNNTYSFLNDRKGFVWIGTKGDGLSVSLKPVTAGTDYRSIRYRRYKFDTNDTVSLGNNNIYSICQDSSGRIWIGTYGNGISLILDPYSQPARFIRINQSNSNLSSNLVRNVMTDKSGNLWVATTLGLNLLSRENIDRRNFSFTVFYKDPGNQNSLSYNDVVQLYEDPLGRIWLGTFGGGADRLEYGRDNAWHFTHFTSENGLSNDVVFGILRDRSGDMWFSTENGLTRWNPEKESASIYNTYNGLTYNNFSENTCFARADGSLSFGGYQGVQIVYPGMLVPGKIKPRVELTSFMLFNKEVPVNQSGSPLSTNISFTNSLKLRYNQSSFSISFSALDFLDPAKINYEYKLEHFDEEWNNVGNQHKATYTNVPPGKYIFRVRSSTSNELTGSAERILYIRVRPPWWKTIYAWISYIILSCVVGISIYKTATKMSRYRNELLVEKKVNELKLQFFTNISHEIRTPLTLIISPIEDILSGNSISEKNRTLMEIIHKNAKRMLHLTTQLLDFRKIQNNRMILKITSLDLVPFAREIYSSFIPLAEHKGIQYSFESADGSIIIDADPSRLDIIIYNVISNAIKFTGQGKRVSVRILNAMNGFVDIEVVDEGPGIPQKNLSDIFTRYTILSNRDFAGTGIGLSLSYELAKLHKGDILLSSVEGKGSVFTIRMPVKREKNSDVCIDEDSSEVYHAEVDKKTSELYFDEKSSEVYPDGANKTSERNKTSEPSSRLLIVEDNQEILDYICQGMQSVYSCLGARNGEEGLHIAMSVNPDLIITDIMMPGMNGLEMTRQLKDNFDTSHIPVIMLTSKVEMSDQIAGIETGAEAYIVKPFNMEYLRAVTANLLNQRLRIIARFTSGNDLKIESIKVAGKDEEFLQRIVQYIQENYETDFSIDDVASYCCLGRTVFYNKVKGLTGLPPLEFIRKVKLKIAYQLLEKGFNVSEAAFKTGFTDVKYFSRQFKAQFGITPGRKRSRE